MHLELETLLDLYLLQDEFLRGGACGGADNGYVGERSSRTKRRGANPGKEGERATPAACRTSLCAFRAPSTGRGMP